jgi:hypothetical protein
LAVASFFLHELVVQVVQAAGIGPEKNPVGHKQVAHIGIMNPVVEVLEFGEVLLSHPGAACGIKRLGLAGLKGNDPSWKLAVESDRAATISNEGIDVPEIASCKSGAIENERIGGRQLGGDGLLFGWVGIVG